MITKLLSTLRRTNKNTLPVAASLGLVCLLAASSARAATVGVEPSTVVPGDTFSVEVVGYNQSSPANNIYLTTNNLNPTFGTTTGYANSALGSQTLTVSSTQYTSGLNTIDFLTISVPMNFVPAGTKDNGGSILNGIQFAIGNYFIPTGGIANTLDFNPALSQYSVTGTVTFVSNGVTVAGAVPMTTTLSNSNKGLSTFGVVTSTGDISASDITAFSITITYPSAVPEPSTYAMFALGSAGLFMVVVRRRRARA